VCVCVCVYARGARRRIKTHCTAVGCRARYNLFYAVVVVVVLLSSSLPFPIWQENTLDNLAIHYGEWPTELKHGSECSRAVIVCRATVLLKIEVSSCMLISRCFWWKILVLLPIYSQIWHVSFLDSWEIGFILQHLSHSIEFSSFCIARYHKLQICTHTTGHPWPLTSHRIRKNSLEMEKQLSRVKKWRNFQESNRGGSLSPGWTEAIDVMCTEGIITALQHIQWVNRPILFSYCI